MATKTKDQKTTTVQEKNQSEKFSEQANIRVPKVLKLMKSIATLANKEKYDYDEQQKETILNALKLAVNEIETCFQNGGKKEEVSFRV